MQDEYLQDLDPRELVDPFFFEDHVEPQDDDYEDSDLDDVGQGDDGSEEQEPEEDPPDDDEDSDVVNDYVWVR